MLFLIAFVGAAIIALVLWKAMNSSRSAVPSWRVHSSVPT